MTYKYQYFIKVVVYRHPFVSRSLCYLRSFNHLPLKIAESHRVLLKTGYSNLHSHSPEPGVFIMQTAADSVCLASYCGS
jgi:hypothetical protein